MIETHQTIAQLIGYLMVENEFVHDGGLCIRHVAQDRPQVPIINERVMTSQPEHLIAGMDDTRHEPQVQIINDMWTFILLKLRKSKKLMRMKNQEDMLPHIYGHFLVSSGLKLIFLTSHEGHVLFVSMNSVEHR